MIQLLDQPWKKINCAFDKISLLLQTVLESEAQVFYQLFRWTLVGLLKCPINKSIGSQDHVTI